MLRHLNFYEQFLTGNTMSLVNTAQIGPGSIIRYAIGTGGSLFRAQGYRHTYGYVDDIQYQSQNGDEIDHFETYEIIPVAAETHALLHDHKHRKLDSDAVQLAGLAKNMEWALILEPRRVRPDKQSLGQRHADLVEKRGDISDTEFQDKVRELVRRMGGAYGIRSREGEPLGMGRPATSTWGLYAPIGIDRWNSDDDFEAKERKSGPRRLRKAGTTEGKRYGKMGAEEGTVLDLPLVFAEKALDLKGALITAFTNPSKPGLKPLITMRELWELAKDKDSGLEEYLSEKIIPDDYTLEQAEEEIAADGAPILEPEWGDPRVVSWCLTEPRNDEQTKVITNFNEALALAKQGPDGFLAYQGVGPMLAGNICRSILAAAERKQSSLDETALDATEVRKGILSSWVKLAGDHLVLQGNTRFQKEVINPERYIHSGVDVTVEFVEARGKQPGFKHTYTEGSGLITMLPQRIFKMI